MLHVVDAEHYSGHDVEQVPCYRRSNSLLMVFAPFMKLTIATTKPMRLPTAAMTMKVSRPATQPELSPTMMPTMSATNPDTAMINMAMRWLRKNFIGVPFVV